MTITVAPTAPQITPTPQSPTVQSVSENGFALPYNESNFQGDQNWQSTWGAMKVTFLGFMDLSATANTVGGAIYLKNSTAWTNYTMTASVDWVAGETIGLMADYTDASNYVLCEYAKSNSSTITFDLAQYANGNKTLLSPAASTSWNGNGSGPALSISISGIHGACSFNGQTISNDKIGPGTSPMSSPESGGVGFTINDAIPNISEIVIKKVTVAEN